MRSSSLLGWLVLALWLCTTPARAGDWPQIGLRWNDCPPEGVLRKDFACDSNEGAPFELVLFVTPPAMADFVGFIAVIDMDFQAQTTPPWWDLPGCRPLNSLTVSQASSDLSCPDISEIPFFFASDYAWGMGYPGRARFRLLGAVEPEDAFPLVPGETVALCRVSLSRRNTVGPEACAGCVTPVCIVLNSVLFDSNTPGGAQVLSSGPKQFVQFQNAISCPFIGSPAVPSSWGRLKSLYR